MEVLSRWVDEGGGVCEGGGVVDDAASSGKRRLPFEFSAAHVILKSGACDCSLDAGKETSMQAPGNSVRGHLGMCFAGASMCLCTGHI
jgi:hypothetical protein